jgi:hypothetical protein
MKSAKRRAVERGAWREAGRGRNGGRTGGWNGRRAGSHGHGQRSLARTLLTFSLQYFYERLTFPFYFSERLTFPLQYCLTLKVCSHLVL